MEMTLALVVEHTADRCRVRVLGGSEVSPAGYAEPFRPRAGSIGPGHLVAIDPATAPPLVTWRWFPAVVLRVDGERITLDEPFHGTIEAPPVTPPPAVGGTVYATTGLSDGWRVDATADEPERAAAVLPQIADLDARNGWAWRSSLRFRAPPPADMAQARPERRSSASSSPADRRPARQHVGVQLARS